jgi:serine phosphatase RsbU (regulator of sigma subunit)
MSSFLILSTLNLSLGGLVFLLGLIILRENPRHRLNRTVAMMLFFGGVGAVLAALSLMAAHAPAATGGAAGAPSLIESVSYVWEFFFPTLFLFASIFPVERAYTRRIPFLAGRPFAPGFGTLVFAPHLFHFALMLVLLVWRPEVELPRVGALRYLGSIVGVAGVFVRMFLLVHQALFSLVNLGFGLATMALLFDSYRRSQVPRLKQQLRVIAVGLSACLGCYSFATTIPQMLNLQVDPGVRSWLTIAALTLGPGSIAYAIVRHKFLDARLLARRGILYALASAALVGLYLVVLQPLNRILTAVPGVDARVFTPVFLVMALALFQPAIARLEEVLDRVLLKDPADYRNVLRQLGRDLQTTIDLEVLMSRTIRTLADALLLQGAHVVALTGNGAIAHSGGGAPLAPGALSRLADILPRVSARASSYRVSEGVEGLTPEEQAELGDGRSAALLVPLRWHGDVLGALLLGDKLTGTGFSSEDVNLLTTLAAQVSVSLQNALLLRDRVAVARFEEELNLARQIQRTSLLSEFPRIPRCDVHALYIPSKQVGGDFYDVVEAADGSHLVAIADVSGKGVPAALLSAMLQASLRTQSSAGSLGTILQNINALLYRSTAQHQFATFFLARIDGERLRLTFSNAGHNWPVVLRRNGDREFLERGGMLLGIMEQTGYEEAEVALAPGDLVVLYTDGISEAANASGELFGEERLCSVAHALPRELGAREVAERLLAALREFLGELEAQDDMTLLVLRVLEPQPAARVSVETEAAVATR